MTVQEIMERSGIEETSLAIALIKDAIHLIQSQGYDNIATWKASIVDGTREYALPANLINLKHVSIYDEQDKKYKKIKRLIDQPIVTEDTDPE